MTDLLETHKVSQSNHLRNAKPRAVLMANNVSWYPGDVMQYVFGPERIKRIGTLCALHPTRITSQNWEEQLPYLKEAEVIFSCWGMPSLTPQQLDQMPKLKAVFYAGGSAQAFAQPFLEHAIIVCSAIAANAIPVAEFCLAQILLSCKGAFCNMLECRKGPWTSGPGNVPVGNGVYGETVALLGIGAISRHLLKLLKPFNLRIIAVSNYLSPAKARDMGIAELVDLETAFREGYVVSNHLADNTSNKGVLTGAHFASMREGATFINTGRGAQVNEAEMIGVFKKRPDLTALLDVQHPEPPLAESELFQMPNIHLTSHIAGSANHEVRRMADYMIEEFQRWES
ncbi:MAG: hydroxyacid dehydrogenase, partial [Verrucomicrobiota bacterium]